MDSVDQKFTGHRGRTFLCSTVAEPQLGQERLGMTRMTGLESSGGFSPRTPSTWMEMTQSWDLDVNVSPNTRMWSVWVAGASHSMAAGFGEDIPRGTVQEASISKD